MKKKILTIAVVFLLLLQQKNAFSQCPTIDLLANSNALQQIGISTQSLGISTEQLAQLQQTLQAAKDGNILSTLQLNLQKDYFKSLLTPNPAILNPAYNKINLLYNRIQIMTGYNVAGNFLNTMSSKLGADANPYIAAVATFIAAARTDADNIVSKGNDLNNQDIFSMTDAERLASIERLEKDASILISAIKLYYARVQKILVSKKGISSSSLGWLKKIIS